MRMSMSLAGLSALIFFGQNLLGEDIEADAVSRIETLVAHAAASGAKKVEIPKGEYQFNCHDNETWHLNFRKLRDIEIDATGSTFIFETYNKRGILFEDCANVSFHGATLVHRQPPFSQGDIQEIASDGKSIDVKIHDAYPQDIDKGYKTPILSIFDGKDGILKKNVHDIKIENVEALGGGILRFTLKPPLSKSIPVGKGDMAAWRCRAGSGISVNNCEANSISDLTIKNHPGVAIIENGGEGGNYYSYTATYAEPPKGAARRTLLAGSADAFISFNARKGPTLENCLFEGQHDDGVNITGIAALVVANDSDGVVVDYRANWRISPFGKPGDALEVFDEKVRSAGEVKLLSVGDAVEAGAGDEFYKAYGSRRYDGPAGASCLRIKVDRPELAKPGCYIANRNRIGNGFIIRNCVIKDKRGHGVFIRAGEGLIENCRFENMHFGGIVIAPEIRSFSEGSYSRKLVIRNNVIRNGCRATQPWNGALTIAGFERSGDKWGFVPLPGGHREILVEGNRFEDNDGPNIIISSVIGLDVRNNVFVNPMRGESLHNGNSGLDCNALIWATEAEKLNFEGNRVERPGSFMKSTLQMTPSASGTTLQVPEIEKR